MINHATHIYQSEKEFYEAELRGLEHDLEDLTAKWIEAQKREQYCKGKVDLIKEQIDAIKRFSIGEKEVVPDKS